MPHAVRRPVHRPIRRGAVLAALATLAVLGSTVPGAAKPGGPTAGGSGERRTQITLDTAIRQQHARQAASRRERGGQDEGGGEVHELADEYDFARSAPAADVPAAAVQAARAAADRLPVTGGRWAELTDQPLDSSPPGYRFPNIGPNPGGRMVAGRMTTLAANGPVVYAGAADGGVWRSADQGRTWQPLFQDKVTLSIGALLVDQAHALWVGTGEANTSSDSYHGQGVYRTTDGGRSFAKVGGGELDGTVIYRLYRDPATGTIWAASSHGLYRRTDAGRTPWTRVLAPDPSTDYRSNRVTDVITRPGTHGRVVLAAIGWWQGGSYNGLYLSRDSGAPGTFRRIRPGGITNADIGRTSFAYSADGGRLYAVIQSPAKALSGADTELQGVFASASGDPAGPFTRIADSTKLNHSGSALLYQPGYHVGIQASYNQALAVDPANPDHLYLSLEEVFETTNGGRTFRTADPYWWIGLACNPHCPPVTHPDQHALLLRAGQVWIANDGGVYHRPLRAKGYGSWSDDNRTLFTLQYYGVGTGRLPAGTAFWGGLQDNGTSVLNGRNARHNLEPASGDGGRVLVDRTNGRRAVGEYVVQYVYYTTDGGHTYEIITPNCRYNPALAGCDPAARFIAPLAADERNPNVWISGGSKVWVNTANWHSHCTATACDWKAVHSLGIDADGAPNVATALAASGGTIYAGWVGGGGNPGPAFRSGIDTNYGGHWHRVTAPNLPQRYLSGLTIDPANSAHVYAIYNGYSRRYIPTAGTGHVFESTDGGGTWRDISGDLPDAPANDLVLHSGRLVLGTDVAAFTSDAANPQVWSRLGGNLPNTAVNDVALTPSGDRVVAGTHGRGMWTMLWPR